MARGQSGACHGTLLSVSKRQPSTRSRAPRALRQSEGNARRTNRPFAEELPHILAQRGLSLRALAAEIEFSPSHLSRALRRKDYKSPGPRLVRAVAAALGLPEDYFPEAREGEVLERVKADPVLRDRLYDELKRRK
jgi:transcriptional regulator with XRE-family HTH domain